MDIDENHTSFRELKKVLILTDSLSLPRNKPEKVKPKDTWPSLLNNNQDYDIMIMAMGGATIKKLYEQSHYYASFNPDIVIIQSGIVDCAPRALGLLEKEIINSNKLLSAFFHRFMPVSFLRRFRKKTYTSNLNFSKYLDLLFEIFNDSKIIWIGILPASIEYENKLIGIQNNINIYNGIIESKIALTNNLYINTSNIPHNGIMSDHHHLNIEGHQWIYSRLIEANSEPDF